MRGTLGTKITCTTFRSAIIPCSDYYVSVCDIDFGNVLYRSLLYYNMMYIVPWVLCISARWPFAWDFGNEIDIVHKNLVVRVPQSRMTVGRQEQSTLKVPWSSCTIVQVLVRNTVSRKCRQTSKHIIWVHGSSMVRDTKYCQTQLWPLLMFVLHAPFLMP